MRPWRAPRSGGYTGQIKPDKSPLPDPPAPLTFDPPVYDRIERPPGRPSLPPPWRNVCGEPLADASGVFCDRRVKTYADGSKRPHRRHPHRFQWRTR